jgi:hypothetical protein
MILNSVDKQEGASGLKFEATFRLLRPQIHGFDPVVGIMTVRGGTCVSLKIMIWKERASKREAWGKLTGP